MSDETELRAAILADPDDLATRQVYADCLTARDDPRGEYIALACAPGPETDEAELRRRALWQLHGTRWQQTELGRVPSEWGGAFRVTYAHGFADACSLGLISTLQFAEKLSAQPIRKLRIYELGPRLAELIDHPLLATVRELDLGYGLETVPPDVLAKFLASPRLAKLRSLELSPHENAPNVWPALEAFPYFAGLERWATSSIVYSSDRARFLARSSTGLKTLSWTRGMTPITLGAYLDTLAVKLQRLDVQDTDGRAGRDVLLPDRDLAKVLRSPALSELRVLSLFGCHGRGNTADVIRDLPATIDSLDLGSNDSSTIVEALDDCNLPELEWLSIRQNNVRGHHLEMLSRFPKLTTLRVEMNSIGHEGISAIIERAPNLRDLDVTDNPLGDRAVGALAKAPSSRALRELGVSNIGLTAIGLNWMISYGNLFGLRELNITENDLGKTGAKRLAAAPFKMMADLAVSGTMRGEIAPVFAKGWRSNYEAGDYHYERDLTIATDDTLPKKKRTKRGVTITPAESYCEEGYNDRLFGTVALPDARAAAIFHRYGASKLPPSVQRIRVVGGGQTIELAGNGVLDAARDTVLFRIDDGLGHLTHEALLMFPQLAAGAESRILPIANPLASGRRPYRARQIPGTRSVVVLLTQAMSAVDTDALGILDWTDREARWRGEPVTLSREDIEHQVTWSHGITPRPPFIRDVTATADGAILIHQTGKKLLDDGGNWKYGMDWSMLMSVDPATGRAIKIADLAHGYGMFTGDNTRLAVRGMKTMTVELYDFTGASTCKFKIGEDLLEGVNGGYADLDGTSLWLTLGWTGRKRCEIAF